MGKKLNLEWAHLKEGLTESDIQQYCEEHQQQDKLLIFAKMISKQRQSKIHHEHGTVQIK